MSAIRSASANVDWSKIYSGLGLNKGALGFRARRVVTGATPVA